MSPHARLPALSTPLHVRSPSLLASGHSNTHLGPASTASLQQKAHVGQNVAPAPVRETTGKTRVSTSRWLGHCCCLFVKLQLAPRGLLNIVPIQIVGLSSYADKEWERPTSLVRRSAPGVLSLLALPTAGAVVWILTHRPSALSAPLHDGSPPRARFQTTQMPSPAPAASFHERRHVGEIVTSNSFETVTCTRPLACR